MKYLCYNEDLGDPDNCTTVEASDPGEAAETFSANYDRRMCDYEEERVIAVRRVDYSESAPFELFDVRLESQPVYTAYVKKVKP